MRAAEELFTLHADVPHLAGNALAAALLMTAVIQALGPGLGLWLLSLGIIAFIAQGLLANHLSLKKHAEAGNVAASLQGRRVAAARRT